MAMLSGRLTAILSKHLKHMQISLRAVDYLFVRIGCGQGKLIIGDQKRFYSIQAREGSKKENVIQSTPYYYRFIPKFFIRKVGFKTRSYDELNSIDFHEKSDLDSYVPLSEFERVSADNGALRTQLDVANDIICDLLMLVDIRFDVEAKFSAYWLLTPKSTTWQNDMANLVQKELGSLVVSVASPSTIASPLKQKISNLLDESFLKWVYVFKHSIDPFFVDLRTKVSDKDIILMARDLSYVLIVVHHSTHKLIPKSLKIKKPSNDAIKKSLIENYMISEPAVDILFRVLGRA